RNDNWQSVNKLSIVRLLTNPLLSLREPIYRLVAISIYSKTMRLLRRYAPRPERFREHFWALCQQSHRMNNAG
ncbi:MAG: hypothetical protein QME51_07430, partial [Planctomycetota bacterium]|nr:hypothetical protein [Planctomycetota bacterium]